MVFRRLATIIMFTLTLISVIGLASVHAQLAFDNPNLPRVEPPAKTIVSFNNDSGAVNISTFAEIWITNLGNLDDVNATQFENNAGTLNIFTSWLLQFVDIFVNETGDTMTGQLIVKSGNGKIVTSNSAGSIDVQSGIGEAGSISFGNTADIGISRDGVSGGYDYDGAYIFKQKTSNPDEIGEFIWIEENGNWRFALPSSGVGLASYFPRSVVAGGPSKNNATNFECAGWGFQNIDCDTDGTGSDLGVQDDVEILGSLFVIENATVDGSLVCTINNNFCLSSGSPVELLHTNGTRTAFSGSNDEERGQALRDAIASFSTGELILVHTGNYNTRLNMSKDAVNLYFDNGAKVYYQYDSVIYDEVFVGSWTIDGFGEFVSNSTSPPFNNQTIDLTQGNNLTIRAKSIISEEGVAIRVSDSVPTTFISYADLYSSADGTFDSLSANVTMYLFGRRAVSRDNIVLENDGGIIISHIAEIESQGATQPISQSNGELIEIYGARIIAPAGSDWAENSQGSDALRIYGSQIVTDTAGITAFTGYYNDINTGEVIYGDANNVTIRQKTCYQNSSDLRGACDSYIQKVDGVGLVIQF